jgi:nitrogen fixation-related uncharacterized protein
VNQLIPAAIVAFTFAAGVTLWAILGALDDE